MLHRIKIGKKENKKNKIKTSEFYCSLTNNLSFTYDNRLKNPILL